MADWFETNEAGWWASKWQESQAKPNETKPNRLSPMTLNFFIMYLALLLFIYHRCYSLIESLKVIIVASALPMTCQTAVRHMLFASDPIQHPATPLHSRFRQRLRLLLRLLLGLLPLWPYLHTMLAKRHLAGSGLQPAQTADKQLNLCSERFISIRGNLLV